MSLDIGSSDCQLLFHPQLPRLCYAPQEAAKSYKFDFTSRALQQLQIFTRSPYITIMLQNIPKQTEKSTKIFFFELSWVKLLVSCLYTASYEITETPTATTTKHFGPSFIIILNKIR